MEQSPFDQHRAHSPCSQSSHVHHRQPMPNVATAMSTAHSRSNWVIVGDRQRPKATVTRSTVQYPAADPRHTFPPRSGRRNATTSTVIPRVSYSHKCPLSRGVPPSVRPVDTSRGPWYSRASNKQSSSIVVLRRASRDCRALLRLAATPRSHCHSSRRPRKPARRRVLRKGVDMRRFRTPALALLCLLIVALPSFIGCGGGESTTKEIKYGWIWDFTGRASGLGCFRPM